MSVIFHLDLDSFFVSAERIKSPSLRGKVMAVGGAGGRGVITSASYEARKFGVRSAMPTAQALRLCPRLLLVKGDYELYSRLSKQVFEIVDAYAPVFERVSIDEGYLDMTGTRNLYGPPLEAGRALREKIRAATGLTASIGIAANRLVAKVCSDACKPDGLRQIEPGSEPEFLAPMPVRALPGIGPSTEKWLLKWGVLTIGDLQRLSRGTLETGLGSYGLYLADAARGIGSTEFNREPKSRSTSREETFFKDVWDEEQARTELWSMCADVGRSLREDDAWARGVKIKLRYPPFDTVFRSKALPHPTRTDQAIFDVAWQLVLTHWDRARPLRLLGVGCVMGDGERQLGLFEDTRGEARREKLDQLKDEVNKRFGDKALRTGHDLAPKE